MLWTVKHTTRVGQRAVAQPDVDGRSGFLWGGPGTWAVTRPPRDHSTLFQKAELGKAAHLLRRWGGPWTPWLSWLECSPVTERLGVWSRVWACKGGNQSTFLSPPSSLKAMEKCPR